MLNVVAGEGDLTFMTWVPETPTSAAAEAYDGIARALQERGLTLLLERIYGELSIAEGVLEARDEILAPIDPHGVPPAYVEGSPCGGGGLAGIHIVAARAVNGGESRLVETEGKAGGRLVRGRDAWYLALSDVGRLVRQTAPSSPEDEAGRTLEMAGRQLEAVGWSFRDVCRTWFYLTDILDWYGEFNRTRNKFFETVGLSPSAVNGAIPASTGIHGRNARGGWCTLDLLAVKPAEGRPFAVRRLAHSRQNEATQYGSAFSRGLELALGGRRYAFVSGTASIDERGESQHHRQFARQMETTLASVEAVLAAAGATLGDLSQATAFLKHAEDVDTYRRVARDAGLSATPTVCTRADVCREELLFELDGTAVLPPLEAA